MTSPHITAVTKENFNDEVIKSDKLVLIDFYADWCGPCRALAPTLEKIAEENQANVKVVKINVDQSPELAAAFQIRSLPSLITVKNDEAIYGSIGNVPKAQIEALIKKSFEYINNPPAKPVNNGPKP